MKMKKFWTVAMAVAISLGTVSAVSANTVEIKFAGISGSAGNWTWKYDAYLTTGNFVQDYLVGERDYVVFVDVDGLVGNGTFITAIAGDVDYAPNPFFTYVDPQASPLNAATVLTLGLTPADNVEFSFTGTGLANSSGSDIYLGQFQFTSTLATAAFGQIVTTDTSTTEGPNIYFPTRLMPRAGGLDLTPLPASAWGGIALFGIIGAARLRSRKIAVSK